MSTASHRPTLCPTTPPPTVGTPVEGTAAWTGLHIHSPPLWSSTLVLTFTVSFIRHLLADTEEGRPAFKGRVLESSASRILSNCSCPSPALSIPMLLHPHSSHTPSPVDSLHHCISLARSSRVILPVSCLLIFLSLLYLLSPSPLPSPSLPNPPPPPTPSSPIIPPSPPPPPPIPTPACLSESTYPPQLCPTSSSGQSLALRRGAGRRGTCTSR